MTLRKPYVDVNGMMLPLPPGDTIATTGGGDSPVINGATQFQFFDDFFLPRADSASPGFNLIVPNWEMHFNGASSRIYTGGDSGTALGFVRLECAVQASSFTESAAIVIGDRFNGATFDFELEVRIDQQSSSMDKITFFIEMKSITGTDGISIFTGSPTQDDQWYLQIINSGTPTYYTLGALNSGAWKTIKLTHTRGTPNTLRAYYNGALVQTITSAYPTSYDYLIALAGSLVDGNSVSTLDIDYVSLKFLNMTR